MSETNAAKTGVVARLTKFLKKDNNLQLAIAAVAVVALISFVLTLSTGNKSEGAAESTNTGNSQTAQQSAAGLETRLEQILSQVEGAGAVRVLVTYETGPEIVPATKTGTQNNTSDGTNTGQHTTSMTENNEPVVVQGENGTEPLVLVRKEPVVLGVLVVAEGASDLNVRLRLAEAVRVSLQLAPTRIEVLPMNITNNEEGN